MYCVTPRRDAKSAYLRADAEAAGATWRSAASATDRALADLIRRDGIDVLIELTGHTAHNRLGAMRLRPAPVQMTWIGYPNSTGLADVDYRITDAASDPVDTAQTYVEQLLRLPGCFLCYTPMRAPPDVAPAPCAAHGYVTFGSFNALAKVTDDVIEVRWCRRPRCMTPALDAFDVVCGSSLGREQWLRCMVAMRSRKQVYLAFATPRHACPENYAEYVTSRSSGPRAARVWRCCLCVCAWKLFF